MMQPPSGYLSYANAPKPNMPVYCQPYQQRLARCNSNDTNASLKPLAAGQASPNLVAGDPVMTSLTPCRRRQSSSSHPRTSPWAARLAIAADWWLGSEPRPVGFLTACFDSCLAVSLLLMLLETCCCGCCCCRYCSQALLCCSTVALPYLAPPLRGPVGALPLFVEVLE